MKVLCEPYHNANQTEESWGSEKVIIETLDIGNIIVSLNSIILSIQMRKLTYAHVKKYCLVI